MGCPCENTNSIPYYNDCAPSVPPTSVTGCVTTPSSDCVIYAGDVIPGVATEGDTLTVILEKIRETINTGGGSGPTWDNTTNLSCIDDSTSISSLKAFAEAISDQFCTLKSNVNGNGTSIVNITNTVNSIVNPNITGCAYLGVPTAYDTYGEAMNVFAAKICDLNSRLSLSGVNWSQCFAGTTTPTTLSGAFTTLLNQICSVKATADAGGGGGSSTDNYVRTSALDGVSGYLMDKFEFSPCFTVSEVNGSVGKKLTIGLASTLKTYTFDTNQFDTNATSTSCTVNSTISLKQSFIDSIVTEIECDTVSALFSNTDETISTLYGNTSNGCASFSPCNVLKFLSSSGAASNGKYVLQVDNTQTALCDKYKWVPETSGGGSGPGSDACTSLGWVDVSSTMTTSGTASNPAVSWSAQPGGMNSITGTVTSATFPRYRWNINGGLELKGAIRTGFNGTVGSGTGRSYNYEINLGTVQNPCGNTIEAQEHFGAWETAKDFGNPGNFYGSVHAYVFITNLGELKVKVFVNIASNLHDHNITVPLSGITFNF
jgi:hypothetical protein